jgi:hypothetical protein
MMRFSPPSRWALSWFDLSEALRAIHSTTQERNAGNGGAEAK